MSPAAAKPTRKTAGKKTARKTAALKTVPTSVGVESYLAAVDPARRADCVKLIEIIGSVVGEPPVMWGPSIVGFGSYHYVYDSGHEGDMALAGFSARKNALTLYIFGGLDADPGLMAKLGKHKAGKGCLYVKSLEDVHLPTLKKLVETSVRALRKRYPA